MKTTLSAMIFLVSCSLSILAQTAEAPSLTLRKGAYHPSSYRTTSIWGVPTVPGKILFYGGDTNFEDPNYVGWANGNTLLADASTYGAVIAPKTGKIVVSAVFFNVDTFLGVFDPPTGTYDVRTGFSDGNCGTDITQGSAPQTAVATGRGNEYTTTVSFARPLTARDGVTYWFNETPQCTNPADSACASEFYYLDNTTMETNGVNANAQPPGEIYINSSYFGLTCVKACDASFSGCRGSWGLLK